MTSPQSRGVAVGELPAYGDYASKYGMDLERGAPPRPAWPHVVVIVVGVVLFLIPLLTGMFQRSVHGEQMIATFGPYISAERLDGLRDDLKVLDDARANVVALGANGQAPQGSYGYVDNFVRDYPAIDRDMTQMLDAVEANAPGYRKLASLPPFGVLPWFFALPGLILIGTGIRGVRVARRGGRTPIADAVVLVVGAGLVIAPLALGVFDKAPAGNGLIEGFQSQLTTERVRQVQGYFVTLVGGEGELNSRYVKDVRNVHPDANLGAIDVLQQRWQPMTSEFAGFIGTMNDNVENFDAVVALRNSTQRLGFGAFDGLGWFFLVPGAIAVAAIGFGPVRGLYARTQSKESST